MEKLRFLFLNLSILICLSGYGQGILKEADVTKFIDTYGPMTKELEELGENFDTSNFTTGMNAIAANSKVMVVLDKYGWGEELYNKWVAIALTYSLVKMDQQMEALPKEQRDQFKAAMSAQQLPMDITDEDKKLVRARLSTFDELFENN